MADIRSAAGDGPESQVPGQDQPAQELANLIAQSAPKPRGFWRRRRKRTEDPAPPTTPPPTPAPADTPPTGTTPSDPSPSGKSRTSTPPTDTPTPAEAPDRADAADNTESADNADATDRADVDAADRTDASDNADAADRTDASDNAETADRTDATTSADAPDRADTTEPVSSEPGSAETASDGSSADGTTVDRTTADGTSADGASADQATDVRATADGAAEKRSDSEASTTSRSGRDAPADPASPNATTEPATANGAADNQTSGHASDEASTDTPTAERPGVPSDSPEDRSRTAVGVVYEPEESPDGFPLEYGNIIIGLPKQAANPAHTGATQAPNADDTEASADEASADEASADEASAAEQAATGPTSTTPATTTDDDATSSDAASGTPADGASGTTAETAPGTSDDAAAGTSGEVATGAADDAAPGTAGEAPSSTTGETATATDDGSVPGTTDEAQPGIADAGAGTADEAAAGASEGAAATGDAAAGTTGEAGTRTADDAEPGTSGEVAAGASEEAAATGDAAAGTTGESGTRAADDAEPAPADVAEAAGAAGNAGPAGEADTADRLGADDSVDDVAGDSADVSLGDSEDGGSAPAVVSEGSVGGGADEPGDDADQSAESTDGAGRAADDGSAGDGEGAAGGTERGDDEAAGGAESAGAADAEARGSEGADEAVSGAGGADEAAAGGEAGGDEGELTGEELAARLAAEQAAMALITALMKLRGVLAGSQLPLEVVGADEARQQQKAMLDQLDDYLLPRLVQLEAPVLAVVGGSTGAGKSTLVNTVIGKVVSEPGVLRPTTRSPVLIHHPADADWFVGDRVLPGMARTASDEPGGMEDAGQLRLVAADSVPRGLAILDAPDIDSVVEANRDLATQLLAAADLWLFVTTAARYSDAVPWEFLQSASDRSTAVAVVLDRAPGETIDDITGHLAQMLLERGLGDSPLFSIQETVVDSNGMLPEQAVASIKDWLVDLAADAEARAAVVRRTLQGAVTSMVKKTPPFAAAVKAQAEAAVELRSSVETAYDQGVKDIAKACQDGTLLRGEVLARWQEFVGTGELLKGLQSNAGRLRDRLKNSLGNKPAETRDVSDAIQSGLESLLREHATAAAERAETAWQATAAGRQLLATAEANLATVAEGASSTGDGRSSGGGSRNGASGNGDGLGAVSEQFPANASRVVREWQAFVLDLVRKEGADKKSTARILEYGVNGLGLSLMVVVFASAAGIPKGAEASAGVGSAVVGQRLLEAVFGDKAVQGMVDKAREDLDGKVHALMDAEFARYLAVLDQHPVDAETTRQLTEAARAVEDCT